MVTNTSKTAFEAQRSYIDATSAPHESIHSTFADALRTAYAHADEFSLSTPDASVGQLLSTLTAASSRNAGDKPQAIAITPAASVAGLYLLEGLPDNGILSCIDPEAEHQANAKAVFREAGYKTGHVRFLPSRPLDVLGRLATEAYQVIYAEVPVMDATALLNGTWPLLSPGGTLVIAGALLDGTIADDSRTDRATAAARECEAAALALEGAVVTRLPLGSGLLLVTKR